MTGHVTDGPPDNLAMAFAMDGHPGPSTTL